MKVKYLNQISKILGKKPTFHVKLYTFSSYRNSHIVTERSKRLIISNIVYICVHMYSRIHTKFNAHTGQATLIMEKLIQSSNYII